MGGVERSGTSEGHDAPLTRRPELGHKAPRGIEEGSIDRYFFITML